MIVPAMPLALVLLLAAADAGVVPRGEARALAAGLALAADPEAPVRRELPVRSVPGTRAFADVRSGASTAAPPARPATARSAPGPAPAGAPPAADASGARAAEPPSSVSITEPSPAALADAGLERTATGVRVARGGGADAGVGSAAGPARAGATDGGDRTAELLEQSRAQTEALQALAAQQAAAEQARVAEQQAHSERVLALEDARSALSDSVAGLQTGSWSGAQLSQTSAALRQTAAAAAAAGSGLEASRTTEAARLVDAARAALDQRNSQVAQAYLARASQLLSEAQTTRSR